MCKVMMMAGIKPHRVERAWKWARQAAPLLSAHDSDGFGYAAAAQGQLFGERWLNPKDAFKRHCIQTRGERFTSAQFGTAVDMLDVYNRFGDLALLPHTQSIMLHARFATCAKGLHNTHPFVDATQSTALIHNGVISNTGELQNITSSCDSECILNEYESSKVSHRPENIQDVADMLRGYYACGILTHDGEQQVLDVFKSARASLYVAWVPALGAHVFCTSDEILRGTARRCKMRIASLAEVNEGHLIRLSVITGHVLSVTDFEESAWDRVTADHTLHAHPTPDYPTLVDDDETRPFLSARGR